MIQTYPFCSLTVTSPGPQAGGEDFIALTPAEFDLRQQRDLFALSWQSHQYRYGIGVEIEAWMRAGVDVVVNRSREYLPQASQPFVQLLEVSADVIHQRLVERGRESAEEIEAHITHNQQRPIIVKHTHLQVSVLNNDGPLAETGDPLH